MYKTILLLIILGLSIPLLHAKPSSTNKGSKKTQLNNAEEVLDTPDFWDFDPHADAKTEQSSASTEKKDIAPFKESKKSKVKSPQGTFDELEQIVKDIELTIASLGKKEQPKKVIRAERMLLDGVVTPFDNVIGQPVQAVTQAVVQVTPLEEEQLFGNEETILNEEEDLNVDNGETGTLPEEEEEDGETGTLPEEEEEDGETGPFPEEQDEEEEEQGGNTPDETPEEGQEQPEEPQEENGNENEEPQEQEETPEENQTDDDGVTDLPDSVADNRGMGTVTLSGSIEYDTPFDIYDKESGKREFINTLASVLSIDTSAVRVTNIRRGSVIFDFEITTPLARSQDKDSAVAATNIMDNKINAATQDGRLNLSNIPVMTYKRQILVFSPVDETNEPKGMGWIVTLATLLSFMILGLMCWLLYQQKKLKNDPTAWSKQIKYQLPSEQEGRADWESGANASQNVVNQSESIKFYPVSPPNVFNFDGRNNQPASPDAGISPGKFKTN